MIGAVLETIKERITTTNTQSAFTGIFLTLHYIITAVEDEKEMLGYFLNMSPLMNKVVFENITVVSEVLLPLGTAMVQSTTIPAEQIEAVQAEIQNQLLKFASR
jgi:hypothetical protein